MKRKGSGNYEILKDQNRAHFLEFEQEPFIRKFHLNHDDSFIYFRMLGKMYVLDRKTGIISRNGREASINAAMTVYDMLCHSRENVSLDGAWVGLSGLGGIIATKHLVSLKDPDMELYAGKSEQIRKACDTFGGTPMEQGDVSAVLPVFDFFPVWFQFWDGDEEFPPSFTFLWDRNTLAFLHYETLWYVMGFIKEEIRTEIGLKARGDAAQPF